MKATVMTRSASPLCPNVAIGLLFALLPLAGCTVGADFRQPAPPSVAGYTAGSISPQPAMPGTPLGVAQHFVIESSAPADWWRNFGSTKLDALIDRSLHASPTLAAAQATLQQAQQTYAAQAGNSLYPQVNAKLGAQREVFNSAIFGQPGGNKIFNLYNADVAVSYNFDLFGGNRRTLEAYAAQADYQRYQLQAAQLTLAANIATAAMTQAQFAAQIQATEAILAMQKNQLSIAQQRLALGVVARGDVLTLQTQVEQTRAGIPVLRNRLEQTNHLLAVLLGQAPGAGMVPQFALSDFTVPTDLPLVIPSELVRQRPDIQASEALLHVANAQYGAAIATAYPQIGLSADLGSEALTTASLFSPGSMIWSIAGQLTQPLFNGGLKAGINASKAGFDIATANYRQTVLLALRNVADVLRALDNDAEILAAQTAADAAAQESLNLVQQQYQLGGASYLQLLTAQQQAQQTSINLIAAQTQRLTDTTALYQAMGGGLGRSDKTGEIAPTINKQSNKLTSYNQADIHALPISSSLHKEFL